MKLSNGVHQSQAEPRAALLAGAGVIYPEEGFKNPLPEVLWNAGPLILHRNAKPLCAVLYTERYGTSLWAVF